jgi:parallel beta-helix repeat protein
MFRSPGTVVLALLVAVGAIPPALAAEGRTPIFAAGTVLVDDGAYVVTAPLAGGAGAVITVNAFKVDIDLNGMVLTNNGANFPVINVLPGVDQVTIRNGTLSSGSVGIEALGQTRSVTVEDVRIVDMLVGAGRGIHLDDVRAAVIRRVEIADTLGEGISWDGGFLRRHGTIEDNLIQRTAGGIILSAPNEGFSLSVRNNRVFEAGTGNAGQFVGYGIVVGGFNGSIIAENTVNQARADGIFIRQSRSLKIYNNTVSGSGGNGIRLDSNSFGNLVLDNVAVSNGTALLPIGGSGVLVEGGSNTIQGNLLNNNLGFGLQFCNNNLSCGNTFGQNTARFNQGSVTGFCGACGGTPALFPPDSCNVSCFPTQNNSLGNNLIPGPPVL